MKFQAEDPQAGYTVSAHGSGFVEINRQRYTHGVCLGMEVPPEPWGLQGFAALTEADFARLAEFNPELVIVGTGAAQRFVAPSLMRALMQRGVGFEVMNTPAACRTYNILVGEGRRALAALLVDGVA